MTVATVRRVRSLLLVLAALLVTLAPAPAALAAPVAKPGAEVVSVTQVTDRQVDLGCAVGGARRPDRARPAAHARRRWDRRTAAGTGRRCGCRCCIGCCGDYTSWTSRTDVAGIESRATSSWSCRRRAGTLVQRPVEQRRGRRPGSGRPSTLQELRRLLESDWGAGSRRVVAGPSMGGQGALLYAARHPGMFRATAAYSAPCTRS